MRNEEGRTVWGEPRAGSWTHKERRPPTPTASPAPHSGTETSRQTASGADGASSSAQPALSLRPRAEIPSRTLPGPRPSRAPRAAHTGNPGLGRAEEPTSGGEPPDKSQEWPKGAERRQQNPHLSAAPWSAPFRSAACTARPTLPPRLTPPLRTFATLRAREALTDWRTDAALNLILFFRFRFYLNLI